MKDYAIESGVKIPTKGKRVNYKYPFGRMDIGDSFFVPVESLDSKNPANAIKSAAYVYGRRHERKFVTRQVANDEGKIIGFRVWRVD